MAAGNSLRDVLIEHTCIFASFDQSVNADVSRGDRRGRINRAVARHDLNGGRMGGGLVFDAKDHAWAEDEFLFSAAGNFPFRDSTFDGTISLWLKGDPDAELSPQFPVDPFHISRHPSDASFYLDLTKPNDWRYGSPRKLRFGFYNDSPEQNMFVGGQLIVAGELGWHDRAWHHLAATWRNANSGRADGLAALYVDGQLRGTMAGYEHRLTMQLDELNMGLGQRYVGSIDELLIADVALSHDQVRSLYRNPEPLTVCFD